MHEKFLAIIGIAWIGMILQALMMGSWLPIVAMFGVNGVIFGVKMLTDPD